ncbi:MAG: hypothetical protein ACLFU0_04745 [Alphaproteobacteria bacterium]
MCPLAVLISNPQKEATPRVLVARDGDNPDDADLNRHLLRLDLALLAAPRLLLPG